jgi:hypothetical protein
MVDLFVYVLVTIANDEVIVALSRRSRRDIAERSPIGQARNAGSRAKNARPLFNFYLRHSCKSATHLGFFIRTTGNASRAHSISSYQLRTGAGDEARTRDTVTLASVPPSFKVRIISVANFVVVRCLALTERNEVDLDEREHALTTILQRSIP